MRNIKSWGLWHGKLAMSVVDIRSYTLQLIQLVSMVDFRHLDLFNFIVFFDFCFLTNAWFTFSCFFFSERVNFGFHELGSVLRKLKDAEKLIGLQSNAVKSYILKANALILVRNCFPSFFFLTGDWVFQLKFLGTPRSTSHSVYFRTCTRVFMWTYEYFSCILFAIQI